jgi:hypothetical protein
MRASGPARCRCRLSSARLVQPLLGGSPLSSHRLLFVIVQPDAPMDRKAAEKVLTFKLGVLSALRGGQVPVRDAGAFTREDDGTHRLVVYPVSPR